MNISWEQLTTNTQLQDIKHLSQQTPQIIFKHSTRCSISTMVLNRLERNFVETNAKYYFLDLISYRSLSNAVAEEFNVYHESPQILIINKGDCVFDESHNAINMDEIIEQIAQLN